MELFQYSKLLLCKSSCRYFLNPTNWGKGQVFINGHNIGRYWPSIGPQITLYIPKPYLKHHNTIIMLELEKSGNCHREFCTISFIDYPIFNFTNNQNNHG
ncbi:Beta-galactosidase [Dirofilaria immitis]|nr:Beta-galactosidase [Dirofilaria immitis]